jgi:hypothetical protein
VIKAQFLINKNGHWDFEIDGETVKIPLPKRGDKIEYKGKTFEVFDIDVEYDIYDIYLITTN